MVTIWGDSGHRTDGPAGLKWTVIQCRPTQSMRVTASLTARPLYIKEGNYYERHDTARGKSAG